MFFVLALAFFVLTGGLSALLLPNSGSYGLQSISPGQTFVIPGDVNNLINQEVAFTSLVTSFEIAAFITIFIGLALPWVKSQARNKAPAQPAVSPP